MRNEFSETFPPTATVGEKLGALIEAGEMRDIIFFERPADASAHSNASVFVIEPGDEFAHLVSVRYGELSRSLIQIVSGLSPGERLIVTNMSKWNASPRVRLR